MKRMHQVLGERDQTNVVAGDIDAIDPSAKRIKKQQQRRRRQQRPRRSLANHILDRQRYGIRIRKRRACASKLSKQRHQGVMSMLTGSHSDRCRTLSFIENTEEEEEQSRLRPRYARNDEERAPVFCVRFSGSVDRVAVADEEGYVNIRRSARSKPVRRHSTSRFLAHHNAIFDLAWAEADRSLFTGSGDQTACLFDVETSAKIATFSGHNGSVKSLGVNPRNHGLLATGARDGHLFLWDARVSGGASVSPRVEMRNVHALKSLLPSKRRRRGSDYDTPSNRDSQHSVTSVSFMGDGRTLLSAGSIDGAVKIWDMRRLFYRKKPQPVRVVLPPGDKRRIGITSIQLDASNTRLLVSYHRRAIRLYDLMGSSRNSRILKSFEGHRSGSFYVKAVFSPDERYVASGSCDGDVCVWSVDGGESVVQPTVRLHGHAQEVNAVDWRRGAPGGAFECLASSSDDGTVRLWQPDRVV